MAPIVADPETDAVRAVRALIAEGLLVEAQGLARRLHAEHPDDALLEATLLALESNGGRAAAGHAYARVTEIVRSHPGLQFPKLLKGDLAKDLRFIDDAVSTYTELLPVAPGAGYVELKIVEALGMAKRWREAWAHFQQAVRLGAEITFMHRNNGYLVGTLAGHRRDAARLVFPLTRSPWERLRLVIRPTQQYQMTLSMLASSIGLAAGLWWLLAVGTASLLFMWVLLMPVCEDRCRALVFFAATLPPMLYAIPESEAFRAAARALGWAGALLAAGWFVRVVLRNRDRSRPVVVGGA